MLHRFASDSENSEEKKNQNDSLFLKESSMISSAGIIYWFLTVDTFYF